ncbi:MAG: amidohydrolase [Kurthia sp.]|nr:amidohydrolase [Candidatus Kurthia equi]
MKQFSAYDFLQANRKKFTELSNQIWEVPELHFREKKAASLVGKALKDAGFKVTENVAGLETALLGSYGDGKTVIAYLGEYDALPNLSQKSGVAHLDPKEKGGNGHGCGHNLLGTGSFAAACTLKDYIEKTGADVTVRFYGCPAEENGSGKAYMAKAGVFDDVDVAISWHPNVINAVMNARSLANYATTFQFTGVSSHAAASPQLGRSALDAVELMNVGVNYLREHIIQDARVHYAVTNSGGTSPNVVQPYAEVTYLIRAPKKKEVIEIYHRIQKIAQGAALMTETSFKEHFEGAASDLIPNQVLNEVMQKAAEESEKITLTEKDYEFAESIYESLDEDSKTGAYDMMSPHQKEALGKRKINNLVTPLLPEMIMYGSTDVGDVSWVTPTVQLAGSCWAIGTPMHTWQVVAQGQSPVAQKGMLFAAEVMARTAISCIENPEVIEKAKAELHERLNGVSYESLIPSV